MAAEPQFCLQLSETDRAIWYALTALEQELAHWSVRQSPRQARLVTRLLNDVWAIWDNEWKDDGAAPLLVLNLLDLIAKKAPSPGVSHHIDKLRELIKSRG